MPLGTHITLDCISCKLDNLFKNIHSLELFISTFEKEIKNANLTVVGKASHYFSKDAITLTFILKESHINIHTWPELSYVSADIYVCNYSQNNILAAEKIAEAIESIFLPEQINKQYISRTHQCNDGNTNSRQKN